jgi:hypothetical protein
MTGINTQAIAAAKAVLAKCAANDPWFPQPSEATILAWAEQIALTNLELADLLAGVTAAYRERGSGFRPLARDIIAAANAVREDRFQRQPLADIEAHNDQMDERLKSLVFELAEAKSIDRALKYHRPKHNPLNVACTYCHASIGHRCTSGGVTMRRYHDSRLKAAAPPKPPEDTAWPICTACGKNCLVTDEDAARGVCTSCHQASTPQPEAEVPERNRA